jgi:hypothetical protein
MKKTVANKWIKALRSGKYEQGKNCLRSFDDKFCCLGVLCDIMDIPHWKLPTASDAAFNRLDSYSGSYRFGCNPEDIKTYAGLLPPMAIKTAGMKSEDRDLFWSTQEERNEAKKKYGAVTLVGMNDHGRTFEQIADVIEEHWEKI